MATDMPQSLQKGTGLLTPQDKAVVWQAVADNGVPTTANQGLTLGMTARVDVAVSETAGGTFRFQVYWFYSDAGIWVQDLGIGTVPCAANSTAGALTIPGAASKIYVRVFSFAGAGQANVWIIGRGSLGRF